MPGTGGGPGPGTFGSPTGGPDESVMLWSVLVNWFIKLRGRIGENRDWHNYFFTQTAYHAYATYLALRQIIKTYIPVASHNAEVNADRYTDSKVGTLQGVLTALITLAVKTLTALIGVVTTALQGFEKFTIGKLGDIIDLLNKVVAIVGALLTDPTKLAAWLLHAMIAAIWSYIKDQQDAIAAWVGRNLLTLAVKSASMVEEWIVKFL